MRGMREAASHQPSFVPSPGVSTTSVSATLASATKQARSLMLDYVSGRQVSWACCAG